LIAALCGRNSAYQLPCMLACPRYWPLAPSGVWPLSAGVITPLSAAREMGSEIDLCHHPNGKGACFTHMETFHEWPKDCDQVLLLYYYCRYCRLQPGVQPDQAIRTQQRNPVPPVPARSCQVIYSVRDHAALHTAKRGCCTIPVNNLTDQMTPGVRSRPPTSSELCT
jgi:hypothetical protein